jgi:hypothetical protein
MMAKRWQEWLMLIAGAWFAAAPWVLGFVEQLSTAALSNMVIVGVAIAAISLGELVKPKMWEAVVMLLIGLWAMASPWLVGFSAVGMAMANALIVGAVVFALALWDGIAHFDLMKYLGGGRGHAH